MIVQSLTTNGSSAKEIEVSMFNLEANQDLVAQSIRIYLANQRQGTAKTKSRGEVDLTKKKVYKQKHTGNARHGAQSAPLFVGGGVTHGPHGNANWTLSLSKKMRTQSVLAALSMQAQAGNLRVIELGKQTGKTKDLALLLKTAELKDRKVLIVIDQTLPELIQASQNMKNVLCTRVDRINVYEILAAHHLLVTTQALTALETKFSKKETSAQEAVEAVAPKKVTVKSKTPEVKVKAVSKKVVAKKTKVKEA